MFSNKIHTKSKHHVNDRYIFICNINLSYLIRTQSLPQSSVVNTSLVKTKADCFIFMFSKVK